MPRRISRAGLGAFAFLCLTAFSCPKKVVDYFQIAYPKAGSNEIRARWLNRKTGQWETTDPPNATAAGGVGGAATQDGFMSILMWATASDKLRFSWGLGALYDQGTDEETSQAALSPPVAVSAPDKYNWLIAFQTTGDKIALRHFNNDTRSFANVDYAPIENAANDNASGRPFLARKASTVVLGWVRGSELRFAVGTVTGLGIPTFTNTFGVTFPTEVAGDCYAGPASPSAASAGAAFYLVIRRSTVRCPNYSGEFLSRDDLFLFSSTDGVSWQPNNPIAKRSQVKIPFGTTSMAGWDDGTLLVGLVANQSPTLWKFRNGTWTELNASTIFAGTPSNAGFAIWSAKGLFNQNTTIIPF